jgi:hypothetical protein
LHPRYDVIRFRFSGFQTFLRRSHNGGDGAGNRSDEYGGSDADWYMTSRAILPHFDDVDCDAEDGVTMPPKRRRLHLNDLPDEVLIKVYFFLLFF